MKFDDEARKQEQLDDRWHVPARDEMRQLLEKYFVGPISEEFVDLIEARFLAGREDRGAWASYFSHFESCGAALKDRLKTPIEGCSTVDPRRRQPGIA